jgi:hypothetical protein
LSVSMTVATADEIKLLILEFQSAGVALHQTLNGSLGGAKNFGVKVVIVGGALPGGFVRLSAMMRTQNLLLIRLSGSITKKKSRRVSAITSNETQIPNLQVKNYR